MCGLRKKERAIGLFLILDQASKFIAFRLQIATINQRVFFGKLFVEYLAVWLVAILAVAGIFFWQKRYFGILLILIGGVSNLVDRVFYGGVVDFIKLPLIPLFNLADVLICFGIGLFLKELFFND